MDRMRVSLPDELGKEFRIEVSKELGTKKNNLALALQDAVKLWVEMHRTARSNIAKKAWATRRAKKE